MVIPRDFEFESEFEFETGCCESFQGLKEFFECCSMSHTQTDAVEIFHLENIYHAHSNRFQVSQTEV